MARKRHAEPKIKPWPGSVFTLKIDWKKGGLFGDRHLWVHLERRAPGRFGRLQIMHAIVPTRKKVTGVNKFFGSARYRNNLHAAAVKRLEQTGVSERQRREFTAQVAGEYPIPTLDELYLESLESPWIARSLGDRKRELSFFKTGIPEVTEEDRKLIAGCLAQLIKKMKQGPDGLTKMIEFLQAGF